MLNQPARRNKPSAEQLPRENPASTRHRITRSIYQAPSIARALTWRKAMATPCPPQKSEPAWLGVPALRQQIRETPRIRLAVPAGPAPA
jgi:hypothetical protein